MTFRRLYSAQGVHNYFWKARPLTEAPPTADAEASEKENRRHEQSGIRDQVAIVGMGCTRFGELWDKGVDDLLTDAATETCRLGRRGHGRHRRLLARHHDVGVCGHHPVATPQAGLQAGDPGRELLRHRVGGLPQRVLRRGLGRLRRWPWPSGWRSSRTPATRASPASDPVGDGTDPRAVARRPPSPSSSPSYATSTAWTPRR